MDKGLLGAYYVLSILSLFSTIGGGICLFCSVLADDIPMWTYGICALSVVFAVGGGYFGWLTRTYDLPPVAFWRKSAVELLGGYIGACLLWALRFAMYPFFVTLVIILLIG